METINMHHQFDFNVFMKRRGVMTLIGAVVCAAMHNAAGRKNGTSKIGSFTCRSFHRDTKASKRAKSSHIDKL